ncbi:MAG: bacteriohemerythrin [Deltaproteobacteria bacterium]|nr:bacteriohemerythrin [Deltaproteobacteria bacterium]
MIISHKLIINNLINVAVISLLIVFILLSVKDTRHKATLTKDESSVFLIKSLEAKLDVVQVQQWLTDISATRAKDGFDDGFVEAEKSAKGFKKKLGEIRVMFVNENDKEKVQLIDHILLDFDVYYKTGRKMAQAYIDQGSEGGNKLMPVFDETAMKLQGNVNILLDDQYQELDTNMNGILNSINNLQTQVLITSLIGIIIIIIFAFAIIRNITTLLHNMIGNLSTSSQQVTSAANEISKSSISLSEGATEQAANLEETSSTMEEIAGQARDSFDASEITATKMSEVSKMVKTSAEQSKQAAFFSNDTQKSAEQGAESMKEIVLAMKEILISSGKVEEIIEVINEIAHQTKMLATNAAIEAARAGEMGKGFAVVADEVSKLAENSKAASKEINSLIKESSKKAEKGNQLAEKGMSVLEDILNKSKSVSEIMKDILFNSSEQTLRVTEVEGYITKINNYSGDQARGVAEISNAIIQLDQVTQGNAANAEETASASEELSTQAEMMSELVQNCSKYVSSKSQKQSTYQHPPEYDYQEPKNIKRNELDLRHFNKFAKSEYEPQIQERSPKPVKVLSASKADIPHKNFMEWTDSMSVKIPSIDQQHFKLFEMANKLYDFVNKGESSDKLKGIFDDIIKLTVDHFNYEERLFKEHGYDEAEDHMKEHESLLKQIRDVQSRFQSDQQYSIGMDTMNFLKKWLIVHFQGTDIRYSEFLSSKGVH